MEERGGPTSRSLGSDRGLIKVMQRRDDLVRNPDG